MLLLVFKRLFEQGMLECLPHKPWPPGVSSHLLENNQGTSIGVRVPDYVRVVSTTWRRAHDAVRPESVGQLRGLFFSLVAGGCKECSLTSQAHNNQEHLFRLDGLSQTWVTTRVAGVRGNQVLCVRFTHTSTPAGEDVSVVNVPGERGRGQDYKLPACFETREDRRTDDEKATMAEHLDELVTTVQDALWQWWRELAAPRARVAAADEVGDE